MNISDLKFGIFFYVKKNINIVENSLSSKYDSIQSFFLTWKSPNCYVPEVLNVQVNESKKRSTFFRKILFSNSEKLTFEKKMFF